MDFNITITEIALIIWGVIASGIAHHQYNQHHEAARLIYRLLGDEFLRDQMVQAHARFHAAQGEEK
jgi:hypothetical protein